MSHSGNIGKVELGATQVPACLSQSNYAYFLEGIFYN